MRPEPSTKTTFAGSPKFPTTLWSEVRRAGGGDGTQARESLENLCRGYWYPLYVFVRRLGNDHHDAQELIQGFFEHLLETNLLGRADEMKGRFRNYLLLACKSFLRDEWHKRNALKRGGRAVIFSFDAHEAEEADTRYRFEPADPLDAERLFERRWALTLLARALDRLKAEFSGVGKAAQFAAMMPLLTPERGGSSSAGLAACLNLPSEEAARVTLHRFRRRYRELLRTEVAETVDSAEVDDELRHIRQVIAS